MLQRAIRDVFNAAAAMHESEEAEVELRVQFVEVGKGLSRGYSSSGSSAVAALT